MAANRRPLSSDGTISYTRWRFTGRFQDNVWFELNFSRRTSVRAPRRLPRAAPRETIGIARGPSHVFSFYVLYIAAVQHRQEYLCVTRRRECRCIGRKNRSGEASNRVEEDFVA